MVTLITTTCDQPTGFALCERWMARQTRKPDQWIVVDDGVEPISPTMGQEYVRRERDLSRSGSYSFCSNLLEALPRVRGDYVLVVEHDDYYQPEHVERTVALLEAGADLAGDDRQRYYHVGRRAWRLYHNRGAALCQTGFRRELLPYFEGVVRECLEGERYGVDTQFWANAPGTRRLENLQTVVGVKGLPGRKGLGLGHQEAALARWTSDPEAAKLREWVGDADAPTYEALRGSEVFVDVPTLSPGPRPRIESVWFPGDSNQYGRLARVLEYSARKYCPAWDVRVERIGPCSLATQTGKSSADNSWKLEHWANVVNNSKDGDRLLLLDADTFITGDLDSLWSRDFDFAYTTRSEGSRFPLNAGVVAVRVSNATRRFMAEWLERDRAMLVNPTMRAPWRVKYGGHNQASLGSLLERGNPNLKIATFPCSDWNCEDESWERFDPARTRIVHVKSALRMAVFSVGPSFRKLKSLANRWRAVERELCAPA